MFASLKTTFSQDCSNLKQFSPKLFLMKRARHIKTIRKFASETFSTIDFIDLESRENPETVTSRASRIFFID